MWVLKYLSLVNVCSLVVVHVAVLLPSCCPCYCCYRAAVASVFVVVAVSCCFAYTRRAGVRLNAPISGDLNDR
jgi:hypothetical protein